MKDQHTTISEVRQYLKKTKKYMILRQFGVVSAYDSYAGLMIYFGNM